MKQMINYLSGVLAESLFRVRKIKEEQIALF